MNNTSNDVLDRIGALESAVSGLVSSVNALVKDSKEHRDRVEMDQTRLWQALEKQSTKGEMSWGKIASVGGFCMLVVASVGGMNNAIMEGKLRQLQIRDEDQEKITEQRMDFYKEIRTLEQQVRDANDKFLFSKCDEIHEGLRRHVENHQ